mgnify:CR=1 FL=1
MLLVGDGELRETIEEKILEMGLQEKVICTGFKKNAKIYNKKKIKKKKEIYLKLISKFFFFVPLALKKIKILIKFT